jgi:glucokinase
MNDVLAFDVGGTSSRCAVVSDGAIRERRARATIGGAALGPLLVELAEATLAAAGLALDRVDAAGVAVPGPLTADRRAVAFTGNVGLDRYPLAALLEERLGLPVAMDDDANCAALGEATAGAAVGTSLSMTIIVGTGVGAGIVIDDTVHHGAHSLAGELGHVAVAPGGRRCSCGNDGCLEAMANGAALLDRAGRRHAAAADVFRAARAGDAEAAAAIAATAHWVAVGVAAAASIVDPDCVVLAGGIGRQPEIVEAVRAEAPGLCIRPIGSFLDVRPSALDDDAGILGAAQLAAATSAQVKPPSMRSSHS